MVGEIASKSRKEVESLALGLLLPQKIEKRCKTVHFIEATRDLMCDG